MTATRQLTFEVPVPCVPVPRRRKRHGEKPYTCLPPLGPPLTSNMRLDRHTEAGRVRDIRIAVATAASVLRIPKGSHLTAQLHYRPVDGRSTVDEDNLGPTFKAACDAIAKGRGKRHIGLELVPDDSPEWFTKLHPVIHPPVPGKPRLWLVVEVTPCAS
jgi:crossover junction endodeoxyribonuclease RusA